MISRARTLEINELRTAIEMSGLVHLVAENHAYQTLGRILDTGTSLPNEGKEPKEDTEECARIFLRPALWGLMGNPEWADFVVEFEESKFKGGSAK